MRMQDEEQQEDLLRYIGMQNGNIFHFEYVYGDIQIDADHVRTKSANNIFPCKRLMQWSFS